MDACYPSIKSKIKRKDDRFSLLLNDLRIHLKQRQDTYVTTFVDYYGIKEWPGLELDLSKNTPNQIAMKINEATKSLVVSLFPDQQAERRFIPYIAVHEFEALLFSDAQVLSRQLGISEDIILKVLSKCGSPEAINNGPQTAPSKRLNDWSTNNKFLKTTMGITIAEKIGIEKIRTECSLFNDWLNIFEDIQRNST